MFLHCVDYSPIYLRLSFALAASRMKEKARVVSMDLRGHGKSTTSDDSDLSIEVCPSICTRINPLDKTFALPHIIIYVINST